MDIVKIEDNRNNLVVKHKDLVWEARYKLSELGLKVVAILISMINVNDEDFKEYNLKISDFKELIHSDSKKVYEYVDIMTDELMSRPFKVDDQKFNWVYYARYHKGDSYVTLKIAPELKPYLLELKGNFIEYNIINILPLRSNYVIRLYELFKSKWNEYKKYHKNVSSYIFELKIDWMREHFEIPTSYQYSSHIKKLIIQKAQKQFKEKTDIRFDFEEQKIGKRVDRLIITVRDNNKGSSDFLRSLQSFIAYMRHNFVNEDIMKSDGMLLSIDKSGKIYDKYTAKEYKKEDSLKVWNIWYDLAKNGKLYILNQQKIDF